jgi:hypothetical protein
MMQTEKTPPKLQTVETKDGVMLYDPTTGSVVKNMGQPKNDMTPYQKQMMQYRQDQAKQDQVEQKRRLGEKWMEQREAIPNYDKLNSDQKEYMQRQFFDTGVAPNIEVSNDDDWIPFNDSYAPKGYQSQKNKDPQVQARLDRIAQMIDEM